MSQRQNPIQAGNVPSDDEEGDMAFAGKKQQNNNVLTKAYPESEFYPTCDILDRVTIQDLSISEKLDKKDENLASVDDDSEEGKAFAGKKTYPESEKTQIRDVLDGVGRITIQDLSIIEKLDKKTEKRDVMIERLPFPFTKREYERLTKPCRHIKIETPEPTLVSLTDEEFYIRFLEPDPEPDPDPESDPVTTVRGRLIKSKVKRRGGGYILIFADGGKRKKKNCVVSNGNTKKMKTKTMNV